MAVALLFLGLLAVAWGVIETFAYMMSDDPMDAEAHSRDGCVIALVGLVAAIGAIVWMVL